MFDRISDAFSFGGVLVTVGTGKLRKREEQALGLESQHSYAVLEIERSTDGPRFRIKNPWVRNEVWPTEVCATSLRQGK
jgi:calpain-7